MGEKTNWYFRITRKDTLKCMNFKIKEKKLQKLHKGLHGKILHVANKKQ